MDKEQFVKEKLKLGEYTTLTTDIAIGPVYKIFVSGRIENEGFENAFLYIPKGSGIKIHPHKKDVERYRLLTGVLSVNGERVSKNICNIGGLHNIDIVPIDTIIETCKVSQDYLEEKTTEVSDILFDYFFNWDLICQEILYNKPKNKCK